MLETGKGDSKAGPTSQQPVQHGHTLWAGRAGECVCMNLDQINSDAHNFPFKDPVEGAGWAAHTRRTCYRNLRSGNDLPESVYHCFLNQGLEGGRYFTNDNVSI